MYERMVRTTKRCLRKCIGRNLLPLIGLITLMTEVEGIVNSRPLTYISEEINVASLTPSQLLPIYPCTALPQCDIFVYDPEFALSVSSAEFLLQKLHQSQQFLDRYWQQWRDEYLASLRERGDACLRQSRIPTNATPAVSSVVLVKEENYSRIAWPLGRVTAIHSNQDEQTRVGTVRLALGSSITRALCMLYPIECPSGE